MLDVYAVGITDEGKLIDLFTYDRFFKQGECIDIIEKWKKSFEIVVAYIVKDSKKVVYLEHNLDGLGMVKYNTKRKYMEA